MTTGLVYIGDKLMAGGFALSGASVITPQLQADAVWSSFLKAREDADLILISEAYSRLIAERLEDYQRQNTIPPILSLPETGQQTSPVRSTIQAAKTSLGIAQ